MYGIILVHSVDSTGNKDQWFKPCVNPTSENAQGVWTSKGFKKFSVITLLGWEKSFIGQISKVVGNKPARQLQQPATALKCRKKVRDIILSLQQTAKALIRL